MTKQELLSQLRDHFYVALQPSAIHGIGVFAVRDIPQGCRDMFAAGEGEWITLSFEELETLPQHSRDFIETYFLYDEQQYFIPAHGCKMMDVASYLNHSNTPNIISINEGEYFEALRDIKKGEELFVDYGTIVEGVEEYRVSGSE